MKVEYLELGGPVNLALEDYLVKKAYRVSQESRVLKEQLALVDSLVIRVIEASLVSMVCQGREETRETMGQLDRPALPA